MANPLIAPLLVWLGRLKNPYLFTIMAVLFVVDLIVPDPLPLVDELLLGGLTVWLGSRRQKRRSRNGNSGKGTAAH